MRYYKELFKDINDIDMPLIKNAKQIEYYNIETAFDIETTSTKNNGVKSAFMYVWQFGIGYGNATYYGRTWDEFLDCMEMLSIILELNPKKLLVIYVHNLGYEFQFMCKYFTWLDVFAASERKPMKAISDLGIEFRDSYILSGYSLENTAKNLTTHTIPKLIGALDYSLVRTHETPLTDLEIKYCINDVQIVLAYINEQITISGNIAEIPLTNTGRVRKFVREHCNGRTGEKSGRARRYKSYRKIMQDLTVDVPTYTQLKRAFMGGFTHANANHSNQLLHDVTSIDFTSSYPSVMIAEKFPMSRFKPIIVDSVKHLTQLCNKYALIMDIKFSNITAKISQENYISESKCFELINPYINNGRVSMADSLSITLTEIDYIIISQCYEWDEIAITNVKYANKAYLPKPIVESILQLYQGKTVLKDVAGSEVEYLLQKGMLNSVYGMCVTDIVKDSSTFNGDEWETTKPSLTSELIDYNDSRNRFLYYPWGVWITAYARKNLWSGILAIGDDYIYSDTDSLKLFNYSKHKAYIDWFDNNIIDKMNAMCDHYKLDKELLSPKTQKGVTKMLGVWDYEGTYNNFKTLGAKRYLTDHNGKLQLTVAGLSKQNGLDYMVANSDDDVIKVFDQFSDNLHIPSDKTGKMTHTYIDEPQSLTVKDYLNNTAMVHVLTAIHLENCEFTMSLSKQYTLYLNQLKNGYLYKGIKYT